jgi:hypothetical protein
MDNYAVIDSLTKMDTVKYLVILEDSIREMLEDLLRV